MSQPPEDDTGVHSAPHVSTPEQESLPQTGWLGWAITRIARLFAVGILVAMSVLVMEVFLRYLFNSPTIWAHETTTFLSAVTFIFGGLYCVARNSHIRVVLIYDVVSPPMRRMLDILISIACLCASLFFAWASWLMVQKALFRPNGDFYMESSGSAWNSPAPALLKLFLLLVLIAMSLQFLILTFNYIRGPKPPQGYDDV